MEHVKVGEIEFNADYFKLSEQEKEDLCFGVIEVMLEMLDKNLPPIVSRFDILIKLMESSVISNLDEENYEVVAVLENCIKLLNEKTD